MAGRLVVFHKNYGGIFGVQVIESDFSDKFLYIKGIVNDKMENFLESQLNYLSNSERL